MTLSIRGWVVGAVLIVPLLVLASAAARDDAFRPTHRSNPDIPVIVRSEPSTGSDPVGVVFPSTPLVIAGEAVDADGLVWHRILVADGTTGWIRALDVGPLPAGATASPAAGAGAGSPAASPLANPATPATPARS